MNTFLVARGLPAQDTSANFLNGYKAAQEKSRYGTGKGMVLVKVWYW